MIRGHRPAEALHVLVADDDPVQRDLLVSTLTELGCRIDVATTGIEACRMFASRVPDLVIMDIAMPEMDGIEATRRLRQLGGNDNAKRAHVIVLSGHADARSRQLAFEAGCDQYLVKPCNIEGPVRAFVDRLGHRSLTPAV